MSAKKKPTIKSGAAELRELDRAKSQTEALFRLIGDHIYATRNDADHGDVEHIAFELGLNQLIKSTQKRLAGAVSALFNASRNPSEHPKAKSGAN